MHVCSYASLNPVDETNIPISDDMINIRAPTFYAWQTTLLYIFLTAQLCAMLALLSYLFSRNANLKKAVHIIFSGLVALAALISIGCCIAFMILSHMVEYRFHHVSVSGIYEKRQGYSFYLGLTGSLLYLLALFLSIPRTLSVIRDHSGSRGPIETSHYPASGMRYTLEDDFAMRGLPNTPRKGSSDVIILSFLVAGLNVMSAFIRTLFKAPPNYSSFIELYEKIFAYVVEKCCSRIKATSSTSLIVAVVAQNVIGCID
ncbi:unnamed protein product [Cylicostephanus goldi]|uniref:Uncharacterized protein n=1 Tax=Cylicostephanus goldi TaxID=71465 RepID=A0A3P6PYJ8_CYLGO|nr:unnamed protein product [Cylicostephanus goldi]